MSLPTKEHFESLRDVTRLDVLYSYCQNPAFYDANKLIEITDENLSFGEVGLAAVEGNMTRWIAWMESGKIEYLDPHNPNMESRRMHNSVDCILVPPAYIFRDRKKIHR